MMKKALLTPYVSTILLVVTILLLPDTLFADPRIQTVRFIPGNQFVQNGSVYVTNFVDTWESIRLQIQARGYGMAASGVEPNRNYGLAQCYGDLSLSDCEVCYSSARTSLPSRYPINGATLFLDGCFARIENYSFFQEYNGPSDQAVCGNITRQDRQDSGFMVAARQAISQVVSTAPNNNGYARAQVAVAGTTNVSAYVLADCWRTINNANCRACLENASASLLGCVPASEGRALKMGCFMRYSDTNFLNPIPGSGHFFRGKVLVTVVATLSAAAVLIIGAVIGTYMWKNRMIQKRRKGDAEKSVNILNDSSLNFKYSTLEKATGSFDEANKLGQGGYGSVYKGVLPDGREIAVKRLFFNNKHRAANFYNEVNIISSVEHKNLVRLLGCSCVGPESLLVYEYMPNKSLDRFIFDSSKGRVLNWEKRFEIIMGTAEGLMHLHENTKTRTIHRDIKASNVLLDSRFRAKIADFGLARTFQEDKSHISTAIAGTLGYMAPEYLAHGQLTEKADVYSFGVLLLEIVTGRQNNSSKNTEYTDSLVTIAWKHFQQGTVEELFDPNLMLHYHRNLNNLKNEILQVVHVGFLCTQEIPTLRPSMSKALLMLVKKESLPAPTNPPFLDEKTMELNDMSDNVLRTAEYDQSTASVATISHSIFYPR